MHNSKTTCGNFLQNLFHAHSAGPVKVWKHTRTGRLPYFGKMAEKKGKKTTLHLQHNIFHCTNYIYITYFHSIISTVKWVVQQNVGYSSCLSLLVSLMVV